jgi:iron complex transport system substrate-binding protein
MFRLFRSILPSLLAFSLLLAACAPAATPTPTVTVPPPTATPIPSTPTPTPITVTDGLGREVTLAEPAERIVSIASSNTEILFALGAESQLVGRDDFSDYPEAALDIPSIGSAFPSPNAEAIVALDPDLVLVAAITSPDDVQALADLGLTVYTTRFTVSLDDIYADISDIGALAGRAAEAEALVTDLQGRIQTITDKLTGVTERPTVFYELDATDPAAPFTVGPGNYIDEMLTLAGGTNIAASTGEPYPVYSLEQIVVDDPDIIILGTFTYGGQTLETVAARAGWGDLTAVKNGAIYPIDDNLVSRPGPRVVDGIEALARLIHPDLFE